jgi:ABC-type transport system substrate-binding protein
MKRIKITLFLFLFLISSIFVPVMFVAAQSDTSQLRTSLIQAEDNSTMTVVIGAGAFTSWGPTTWEYSVPAQFMVGGQGGSSKGETLEKLWEIRTIPDYPYLEYAPVLATGYDVEEWWPSQENSYGWNNTGGIHVMNITLRENVKFHDGSEWNATVAKWNIDRAYILIGNLTGSEVAGHSDIMGHMCYKPGLTYEGFFTEAWNHSYTYSDDPLYGLPQPPQYYGKNNDPNLSWTTVSKTHIQDGHFPIINKTLVVKSADETASGTGGIIQVEFNDFITDLRLVAWLEMISMEHYSDLGGEDYFYKQIQDQFDWTGDDLACGTGVFEAVEVDKVSQVMKMERFDDYWNFTAMRAAGKMIVKEGLISYIVGDYDGQLVTTAMTAGDGDFTLDGPPFGVLFEDQLITSPLLDWVEYDPQLADIEQLDFIQPATDLTFRKAISYAFNYTGYFTNVLTDRSIRCDNLMGMGSVYLNDSIQGPTFDLTVARNALLNDPQYNSALKAAGINATSPTSDWTDFAGDVDTLSNKSQKELFTFNYLHDLYNVDFTSTLETSIAKIGMVLNKSGATPTIPYGDWQTQSTIGMWWPMLFERPQWYAKDLEAFYVTWPMPKTDLGYLDAFYTYTSQFLNISGTMEWSSIPDTWNWGLISDPELQVLIRALYFSDEAGRFKAYSDIQKRTATETYPSMFVSQIREAYVINKKYAIDWHAWGGFSFSEVMIGPGIPAGGVPIPGFPASFVLIFSIVSILSIGYIIKKKKLT